MSARRKYREPPSTSDLRKAIGIALQQMSVGGTSPSVLDWAKATLQAANRDTSWVVYVP